MDGAHLALICFLLAESIVSWIFPPLIDNTRIRRRCHPPRCSLSQRPAMLAFRSLRCLSFAVVCASCVAGAGDPQSVAKVVSAPLSEHQYRCYQNLT